MDKQPFAGTHDELTERIIKVFYEVYNELGYGFVESVYCRSMAIALTQCGLAVASEVAVPVMFRGELVGTYRADLIVERKVTLEFKKADVITKAHEAQLTHYLRATAIEVGMILNFGEAPKFRRIEFLKRAQATIPEFRSYPVFLPLILVTPCFALAVRMFG